MPKRNIGVEILEGIKEIKSYKNGKTKLKTRKLREPSKPKIIRMKLHLTQSDFADLMGVSIRTLQDWEQGRRKPKGSAKSLLRIAEQYPNVFMKIA